MTARDGKLSCVALVAVAAALVAGCTEAASESESWRRTPLEVGWVPGGAAPRVVYTVSYDSLSVHRTALVTATAGTPVGFEQVADPDANGNAPLVPGDEVATAHWLWAPKGAALEDRSFAFALSESGEGERTILRASWTDDPSLATAGSVPGTLGAVAYDVVRCGDALCVVTARSESGESSSVTVARVDADGDVVGDPEILASGVRGLVRSVHAVPDGDAVDALVVTCEGCDDISYDTWEKDIYGVTSRLLLLEEGAAEPGAPLTTWEGLIEPAAGVALDDGALLAYWRTESETAPDCTDQGRCATARVLVTARWTQGTVELIEGDAIETAELAYLVAAAGAGAEPRVLWRKENPEDRWRRELFLASGELGTAPVTSSRVAETWSPELFLGTRSNSPAALPFVMLDGLAALADGDDTWVAMRYRDLPPGGPEVCGEAARVGIWTGQIATDGMALQASEDKTALVREAACSDGSSCAVGAVGSSNTSPLVPVAIAALALLLVAIRRRRIQS